VAAASPQLHQPIVVFDKRFFTEAVSGKIIQENLIHSLLKSAIINGLEHTKRCAGQAKFSFELVLRSSDYSVHLILMKAESS
jgi:hypothetical protein